MNLDQPADFRRSSTEGRKGAGGQSDLLRLSRSVTESSVSTTDRLTSRSLSPAADATARDVYEVLRRHSGCTRPAVSSASAGVCCINYSLAPSTPATKFRPWSLPGSLRVPGICTYSGQTAYGSRSELGPVLTGSLDRKNGPKSSSRQRLAGGASS